MLLTTEAAKTSQRKDLENHIKTAQNTLEERNNELTKTKASLEQTNQELQDQKTQNNKLNEAAREQTEKFKQLQQAHVDLEGQLNDKVCHDINYLSLFSPTTDIYVF